MPRSSSQSKRSRKNNRQARATLKPKGVSSAPAAESTPPPSSGFTGTSRAQALPYGGKTSTEPVNRGRSSQGLAITREQEYGFIREDLKRLLYTAAILLVVMFALLFMVDR